jgi:hypothetical protein
MTDQRRDWARTEDAAAAEADRRLRDSAGLDPAALGMALAALERIGGEVEAIGRWLNSAHPRAAVLLHDAASSIITAQWAMTAGRLNAAHRLRDQVAEDWPDTG